MTERDDRTADDPIDLDRIDNGDGTHTLCVDRVQVAVVPETDGPISRAVMATVHRIKKEVRFGGSWPDGSPFG